MSIVNIFMPTEDAAHGIKIGEKQPVDAPQKHTVPITSIFMPTDVAFHGMQLGEREKGLARSVSNEIHIPIPPLGQWAKSIRQRVFETSTVSQTRIDVTGWLEMDGRGLIDNHLARTGYQGCRPPQGPFHGG